MDRRLFMTTISACQANARLDAVLGDWLAAQLPERLSKSAIRRLIMAGAIRLDGRPIRRPGATLRVGAKLEASLDLRKLREAHERHDGTVVSPASLDVLYEDDHLLAVAKPANIVMHAAADPNRHDLFNTARQMLAGRTESGRPPYLGLHHRLDVETSGVVLFTKSEAANAPLARQFDRGEVKKTYHAIVTEDRNPATAERTPAHGRAGWRVENRLATVGAGRRARVREVAKGGAGAITAFTILERLRGALLVEARPETGRKHQIRAHLADCHMPIAGDLRYGGSGAVAACRAGRVMLHAWRLVLRHPTTGDEVTITCPYPEDFSSLLACLRRRPVSG